MVAPAHIGRRMWMGCIWVVDSTALVDGLAVGVVHKGGSAIEGGLWF